MKDNRGQYPISVMCDVLEVSSSGYYDWLPRSDSSSRAQGRYQLLRNIEKIHQGSKGSYGSPRIFEQLKALGHKTSKSTVERMMKEHGIRGKKARKYRATTNSKHSHRIAPNIVNRNFDRGEANRVWLADITYLTTEQGWAYLATVIDAHSRKIVGWSVSDSLSTPIVVKALTMAILHEQPIAGLIHHSDRGVQYACDEYRDLLATHRMIQSMSRKGNCWDNAPMESFFDSLKCEHANHVKFGDIDHARESIFEWIEIFYNRQRLHSSIGYKTPCCVHEKSVAKAA